MIEFIRSDFFLKNNFIQEIDKMIEKYLIHSIDKIKNLKHVIFHL